MENAIKLLGRLFECQIKLDENVVSDIIYGHQIRPSMKIVEGFGDGRKACFRIAFIGSEAGDKKIQNRSVPKT